ncbi:hypothetical protein V6Z11_D04G110600 [Gossypium hirsutum]
MGVTPKKSHLEEALRVVRCIKKDPGRGILLSTSGKSQLVVYCNSDWATCPMSKRLITSFCQALRLSNFLKIKELALQIVTYPVFYEHTKHIEIDCHFVQDKIQDGLVQAQHMRKIEQLADFMTTTLGVQQHEFLVSKLGVKDLDQPSN